MAEVTKYGTGFQAPGAVNAVDAAFAEARVRAISSIVAVANGDSANSLHFFGRIPSSAIILPQSQLAHGSITTLADYDVGLFLDNAVVDADLLADGLNLTSAGTKSPIAAVAVGNLGKRLWELLGLATDPGVEYQIVGTMKAGATAASSIALSLLYAKR